MRYLLIYTFISMSLLTACSKKMDKQTSNNEIAYGEIIANAYSNGDWNAIIALTDSFINNNQSIDDLRIAYTEALAATNQIDKALVIIKEGIDKEPDNYYFYKTLGALHHINEDYEEALKNYEKSVKLKETYVRPYLSMAEIYNATNRKSKAIDSYMTAIRIFALNGRFNEVKQYSFAVLDLDKNHFEAYETLSYAFNFDGDYDSEAACLYEYFQLAMSKKEDMHIANSSFLLAKALYHKKEYAASKDFFDITTNLNKLDDENTYWMYCYLSACHQKLENQDLADSYKHKAFIMQQEAGELISKLLEI